MTDAAYGAKKIQKGFDGRPESFTDPWKALIQKFRMGGKPFMVSHLEHMKYKELNELGQELTRLSKKSTDYRWMLEVARQEWYRRQT